MTGTHGIPGLMKGSHKMGHETSDFRDRRDKTGHETPDFRKI